MIAFDLDGTLIDLMSMFKDSVKVLYGLDFYPEKQTEFKVDLPINDRELMIAFDHAMKKHDSVIIYPGIKDMMKELYLKIHQPIKIITNRSIGQATDTYRVVDRICKDIPYTLIINHTRLSKSTFLTKHDIIYVEDRRKYALELEKIGKFVFLVDRPWNQFEIGTDDIKRINNASSVLSYIEDSAFDKYREIM